MQGNERMDLGMVNSAQFMDRKELPCNIKAAIRLVRREKFKPPNNDDIFEVSLYHPNHKPQDVIKYEKIIETMYRAGKPKKRHLTPAYALDEPGVVVCMKIGTHVSIAGNFSIPPWTQFPMTYCPVRQAFAFSLFAANPHLQPGRYQLKFIVDGKWICDAHLPLVNPNFEEVPINLKNNAYDLSPADIFLHHSKKSVNNPITTLNKPPPLAIPSSHTSYSNTNETSATCPAPHHHHPDSSSSTPTPPFHNNLTHHHHHPVIHRRAFTTSYHHQISLPKSPSSPVTNALSPSSTTSLQTFTERSRHHHLTVTHPLQPLTCLSPTAASTPTPSNNNNNKIHQPTNDDDHSLHAGRSQLPRSYSSDLIGKTDVSSTLSHFPDTTLRRILSNTPRFSNIVGCLLTSPVFLLEKREVLVQFDTLFNRNYPLIIDNNLDNKNNNFHVEKSLLNSLNKQFHNNLNHKHLKQLLEKHSNNLDTLLPALSAFRKTYSRHTTNLRLEASGFCIPHPEKANSGGADAYFIAPKAKALGVADGVGEWNAFGINPRSFAASLMRGALFAANHPHRVCPSMEDDAGKRAQCMVQFAFDHSWKLGSSTIAVACLDKLGKRLGAAIVGDSSILVLRRQQHQFLMTSVLRTKELQHSFNCPYQLSRLPAPSTYDDLKAAGYSKLVTSVQSGRSSSSLQSDSPETASVYCSNVIEGDLVIVATDGVFDNLEDCEIIQMVNCSLSPYEAEHVLENSALATPPEHIAAAIARRAFEKSLDRTAKVPFAKHARNALKEHLNFGQSVKNAASAAVAASSSYAMLLNESLLGGKPDDITVVAAWVTREDDNNHACYCCDTNKDATSSDDGFKEMTIIEEEEDDEEEGEQEGGVVVGGQTGGMDDRFYLVESEHWLDLKCPWKSEKRILDFTGGGDEGGGSRLSGGDGFVKRGGGGVPEKGYVAVARILPAGRGSQGMLETRNLRASLPDNHPYVLTSCSVLLDECVNVVVDGVDDVAAMPEGVDKILDVFALLEDYEHPQKRSGGEGQQDTDDGGGMVVV